MRKLALISQILLLFTLSGCFHHCYRARPYTLAQTDLGSCVEEAFNSKSVAAGEMIENCWWHFFEDPQLSRFIEISLACHPDIKIADARICGLNI